MRRFRRTTLITVGCLSVLAGIGLAKKVQINIDYGWLVLLPALMLVKKRGIAGLLAVIILCLAIGLWRGGIYTQKLSQLKSLTAQKVTIEATATTDSVYSKSSQIEFIVNKAQLFQGLPLEKQVPLEGKFKVSGFGVPMVYRGDTVIVTGKLYPMRGSNQARISYAKIETVASDQNVINRLTRKFNAGMQSALPEPQASFAMGLLTGQRSTLPKDITLALTAVGLVHIVAVSGYNLTILVRGIGRLKLGSKYQKLILSLGLIITFVLITGFSASIVRAAIVSVLSLWAWYYGRKLRPLVLISFTAAITGLWNPFYVWSDLGWYLSFLAFFGVLVIAPIIAARLFAVQPKLLTMVLIETLSAELMTLPLILMTFSQLSIVALVANLLIVPLVPVAMLFSAIAGISGAFIPEIAGWFALPARLLLTYMLDLIRLLASIPSALIHMTISLAYMLAAYALVLIVTLVIYKKLSPQRRRVIDKTNAITP